MGGRRRVRTRVRGCARNVRQARRILDREEDAMSTLNDLLNRIDGLEFSARLNIASDLKSFRYTLNAQPEFMELASRLDEDAAAVQSHASELEASPSDPRFEHPFDAAVATYMTA